MDNNQNLDKHYWEEVLSDLDRKEDNAARRYRRHNKSLEAMGEKTVGKERKQQYREDETKAFEAFISFVDRIENEKLLRAIKSLKPIELEIIICRFEHKMQVSEIAKKLGKGVSTVSERLGRIMDKLLKALEE